MHWQQLFSQTQFVRNEYQWVADGSPTHSSGVRIENPLQFVPAGTNPKEFKKLQQLVSSEQRVDCNSFVDFDC